MEVFAKYVDVDTYKPTSKIGKGTADMVSSRTQSWWEHMMEEEDKVCAISLLKVPIESNADLRSGFTRLLSDLRLEPTHFGFVPCYLGYRHSVDMACMAAVAAYKARGTRDSGHQAHAVCLYLEAVKALRLSLDGSEWTLMAVTLLGLYERLISAELKALVTHYQAIQSILEAGGIQHDRSPFVRALVYAGRYLPGRMLVCTHLPGNSDPRNSKYESWLHLPAAAVDAEIPVDTTELARLGHAIFLKLPCLMSYVRSLDTNSTLDSFHAAIGLAKAMLEIKSDLSESLILQRAELVSTNNPIDSYYIGASFKFASVYDHEAALTFWEGRAFLLALCLRIHTVTATDSRLSKVFATDFDVEDLRRERVTTTSRIWMSLQYTITTGMFLVVRSYCPLLACWSALPDVAERLGHPLEALRSWIFSRIIGRVVNGSRSGLVIRNDKGEYVDLTLSDVDRVSDRLSRGYIDIVPRKDRISVPDS